MAAPAAALANRMFERQTWAQQRLADHAGRTFVVIVGPLSTALSIDATGRLEATSLAGLVPDLTLTLSPIGIPSFLANPARRGEFVSVAGDPALAATLQDLAQTLPWFVEQAFAQALGPIVGLRLANAGRRLLAFPEYAAERVGESMASYARDEAGVVAGGRELRNLTAATTALAAGVDSVAARVEAVAARIEAAFPATSAGTSDAKIVPMPRG